MTEDGEGRIRRRYVGKKMSLGDFAVQRLKKDPYLYYSQSIEKFVNASIGALVRAAVTPFLPFPDRLLSAQVWLGSPGVTTVTHIDLPHNLFVQLEGRKQFIVFPPEALGDLHLFPLPHPNHRRSQAPLPLPGEAIPGALTEKFPFLPSALSRAQITVLGAGDVLYLPPLAAHHVTNLDGGFGLSFFNNGVAVDGYASAKLANVVDAAVVHDEALEVRIDAAVRVVRTVVREFFGEVGSVIDRLWRERYRPLFGGLPPTGDVSLCRGVQGDSGVIDALEAQATEAAAGMKRELEVLGRDEHLRTQFLFEFIEMTLYNFHVHPEMFGEVMVRCFLQ